MEVEGIEKFDFRCNKNPSRVITHEGWGFEPGAPG